MIIRIIPLLIPVKQLIHRNTRRIYDTDQRGKARFFIGGFNVTDAHDYQFLLQCRRKVILYRMV